MERFFYEKENQKEISFPIGGIGSGSIGLSGNGLLKDWEIFNRPNKRSFNGYTHFAVKAETEESVLDTRMLLGDFTGELMGSYLRNGKLHSGYGFGPERMSLAGMPHFENVRFEGTFPIANVYFEDPHMPAKVKLMAYNPFIPSNEDDSSIPAAFFEVQTENCFDKKVNYTVAFSVTNPMICLKSVNEVECTDGIYMLSMKPYRVQKEQEEYGDLTIATDAEDVICQRYWYRGNRSDSLETFWKEFNEKGRLKDRFYPEEYELYKGQGRNKDTGVLAAHFELEPGESKKIRFILSWNVPNCYNYWNPEDNSQKTFWKNYYCKLFKDSKSSAIYGMKSWVRLYSATMSFLQGILNSSIPSVAKEAILANISVLKTPTCLRLEDGQFYGFEGCIEDQGCCEGSCSHVWNYAYALPFLFPRLERTMRELEFAYNQDENGKLSFRLQLPLGRERDTFNACVDGQFGSIFKIYREWKISGDDHWLSEMWKKAKKSLAYAWSSKNIDLWDLEKSGIIKGRQHHTLDMELFGVNSWLTGFYLLALKAAAEISAYLGEAEEADMYLSMFENGKKWVSKNLYNGEYFIQKIDLKDKSILMPYAQHKALFGESVYEAYWNEEKEEIKYQIQEGCLIDQVLAQWHANLMGLGEIFEKDKVKTALASIYKYNYYPRLRELTNTWRIYAVDDESGTVICSWPEGKAKPIIPIAYNSEVMAGFEYQVGIHMIQEGLEKEGLDVITAIRERYDGKKRNPWNEIECGSNYARSMASYALLLSYSGFIYDLSKKKIGFSPLQKDIEQCFFWSVDGAWGEVSIREKETIIEVEYGEINLKYIELPYIKDKNVKIKFNEMESDAKQTKDGFAIADNGIVAQAGKRIYIDHGYSG